MKVNLRILRLNVTMCLAIFVCVWIPSAEAQEKPGIDTREWRYLAVGGSLSAGVSQGGVRNSSQKAAFPNLLAKQLGVTRFSLPLFENEHGTGSIKVISTGKGLVFKVDTASAIDEENFTKVAEQVNNIAIPYLKARELAVKENQAGAFIPSFSKQSYKYLSRLLDQGQEGETSYEAYILQRSKDVDFFTWELGTDDFIEYYKKGGIGQSVAFVTLEREGYFPENNIIAKLVASGCKGAIANVPDVLSFPYFQIYKSKSILSSAGEMIYAKRYEGRDLRLLGPDDILLPSEDIINLFAGAGLTGLDPKRPIEDQDLIGIEEIADVSFYNGLIEQFATNNKIPLVDLKGLYTKILEGGYVSEDGVAIDPAFPKGNFFSADGLFPTPVGQAVIANEFIKSINTAYKTNIPLVLIRNIKN